MSHPIRWNKPWVSQMFFYCENFKIYGIIEKKKYLFRSAIFKCLIKPVIFSVVIDFYRIRLVFFFRINSTSDDKNECFTWVKMFWLISTEAFLFILINYSTYHSTYGWFYIWKTIATRTRVQTDYHSQQLFVNKWMNWTNETISCNTFEACT